MSYIRTFLSTMKCYRYVEAMFFNTKFHWYSLLPNQGAATELPGIYKSSTMLESDKSLKIFLKTSFLKVCDCNNFPISDPTSNSSLDNFLAGFLGFCCCLFVFTVKALNKYTDRYHHSDLLCRKVNGRVGNVHSRFENLYSLKAHYYKVC